MLSLLLRFYLMDYQSHIGGDRELATLGAPSGTSHPCLCVLMSYEDVWWRCKYGEQARGASRAIVYFSQPAPGPQAGRQRLEPPPADMPPTCPATLQSSQRSPSTAAPRALPTCSPLGRKNSMALILVSSSSSRPSRISSEICAAGAHGAPGRGFVWGMGRRAEALHGSTRHARGGAPA